MTIDYYQAKDHAPLPPKNADVLTTACDYCIVACGYKVYRWPVNSKDGGMKAAEPAPPPPAATDRESWCG